MFIAYARSFSASIAAARARIAPNGRGVVSAMTIGSQRLVVRYISAIVCVNSCIIQPSSPWNEI